MTSEQSETRTVQLEPGDRVEMGGERYVVVRDEFERKTHLLHEDVYERDFDDD